MLKPNRILNKNASAMQTSIHCWPPHHFHTTQRHPMHNKATRKPEKNACQGILPGLRKAAAHPIRAAAMSNAGLTQGDGTVDVLLIDGYSACSFLIFNRVCLARLDQEKRAASWNARSANLFRFEWSEARSRMALDQASRSSGGQKTQF